MTLEENLKKIKRRDLGRGMFEAINGNIILYHTPTHLPEKNSYWDAIYANNLIRAIDDYPKAVIFQAWFLKKHDRLHAVLIIPINELMEWFENIPTDKQNKWSFNIIESGGAYEIKLTGRFPIDITGFLNPFEQFLPTSKIVEQTKPKDLSTMIGPVKVKVIEEPKSPTSKVIESVEPKSPTSKVIESVEPTNVIEPAKAAIEQETIEPAKVMEPSKVTIEPTARRLQVFTMASESNNEIDAPKIGDTFNIKDIEKIKSRTGTFWSILLEKKTGL